MKSHCVTVSTLVVFLLISASVSIRADEPESEKTCLELIADLRAAIVDWSENQEAISTEASAGNAWLGLSYIVPVAGIAVALDAANCYAE